jgi:hypothetical protein
MAQLSRRSVLFGALAASSALVVPSQLLAQALPVTPVPVPYYPNTRTVTFPTAANDNLSINQRSIVNQQMTKTAIGFKNAGLGLSRANRALRAIGTLARVARVGGPWGFLIGTAVGFGIDLLLSDGSTFSFDNPAGGGFTAIIPAGSNNNTYLMSYPYTASVLDLPMGTSLRRNAQTNPTGLVAYYKVDFPGTTNPPVNLPGGWNRNNTQFIGTSPSVNRTTYAQPITLTQLQNGVVVTQPDAPPGALAQPVADALALPALEADKLHQFMVRQALATDAAENGSQAALPGYQLASPLPFSWPREVPETPPLTVGDWRAPWPAVPPAVDPQTRPWELSQTDWDALPTINPSTGTSTNPNPGQTLDPAGNPLPIATGPEVTPETGEDLPPFEKFVAPFRNAFDPFKNVFAAGSATCPSFTMAPVAFPPFGTMGGQSFTYHCQIIEPFRSVIVAASTAAGGWAAINHIMEA